MTAATIDTEALKARIDSRDLAARYSELRKESTKELSGPCPNCHGSDRFHVTADSFFCRECYPLGNRKPHDCIAFPQWLGKANDFRGAVQWLESWLGGAANVTPAAPVAPARKHDKPLWCEEWWQGEARREMAEAVARLASPEGETGRAYLIGRGLRPETWQAWGLGCGMARDPALHRDRPAIYLPWRGKRAVTAIKYRFCDGLEATEKEAKRYTSKRDGQCLIFGKQLVGEHFQTLFLVEGELNAMSIWQGLRDVGTVNFDVCSFGSESGATNKHITDLAAKYLQVIVWADEEDNARQAMAAIPGALGIKSPYHDGRKLDANEQLQAGILGQFLLSVWADLDTTPAYVARVREWSVGILAPAGD